MRRLLAIWLMVSVAGTVYGAWGDDPTTNTVGTTIIYPGYDDAADVGTLNDNFSNIVTRLDAMYSTARDKLAEDLNMYTNTLAYIKHLDGISGTSYISNFYFKSGHIFGTNGSGTTAQLLATDGASNLYWTTSVGDMLKATYDTGDNGIVDTSDAFIAWTNSGAGSAVLTNADITAGGAWSDAKSGRIWTLTFPTNISVFTNNLDYLLTSEINTFAELQALIADKTVLNEEDVFTLDANWVNTANPWADNEVSDTLTVTAYMQDEDINTFAELQAWVADKTLMNEEDVFTIDANWVNTANPWADNEISDTLTVDGYMEDTDIDTFAELQAWVSDKTLMNEEDIFTIDANWVNTANPWADNEVADNLTVDDAGIASTIARDSEVVAATGGCVQVAGDTMTGNLTVDTGNPSMTYGGGTLSGTNAAIPATYTASLYGANYWQMNYTDGSTKTLYLYQNVYPDTDNTHNLGKADPAGLQWINIYGSNFVENGTALSAKYVPQTRTLTVNGEAGTLTSNLSWTVASGGGDVYSASNNTYSGGTTQAMDAASASNLVMYGGVTFTADNTHDIGATGATRPRDIHVGRDVLIADDCTITDTMSAENGSVSTVAGSIWLTASAPYFHLVDSTGGADDCRLYQNADVFRIQLDNDDDSYSDRLVVMSSGNVGINTNPPQAKLHVNGDLRLSNAVSVTTIETTIQSNDTSLATGKAILDYGTANWGGSTSTNTLDEVAGEGNTTDVSIAVGGLTNNGTMDWSAGNVIHVPLAGSIETYHDNATAGDTLVLAAGTYTITADIDVTKSICIRGQGIGTTKILTTTDSINCLHVTASDVLIQDLTVDVTASATKGIFVDGTGGNVLSNIRVLDAVITLSSHAGSQFAVQIQDASVDLRDVVVSAVSADGYALAIYCLQEATAEAATTVKCYSVDSSSESGAGGNTSAGLYALDSGASQDVIAYLFNSRFIATEGGASTSVGVATDGADALVYAENCIFSATDNDVSNSGGTLQLRSCVLVNGTTSGAITRAGTLHANAVYLDVGPYGSNTTHYGKTEIVTTLTSAAVQAALGRAEDAGGGTVKLIRGTYVWAAAGVIVSNNTQLIGEGMGTLLDGSGQAQTDAMVTLSGSKNRLANFQMLSSSSGAAFHQIELLVGADYCRLENIYADNADSYGIALASGADWNTISKCTVIDSDSHGFFGISGAARSTWSQCLSKSAGGRGYSLPSLAVVVNCVSESATSQGILAGDFSVISSCHVLLSGGTGIYAPHKGVVVGNWINNPGGDGILSVGDNTTITANYIERGTANYAAIKLSGCDDSIVSGNIGWSTSSEHDRFIHVDNGDRNYISGNVCEGQYGVVDYQIDSDCDGNIFTGNSGSGTVSNYILNGATVQPVKTEWAHAMIARDIAVPATVAREITLYSTNTAAAELRVVDGSGNDTLLSPHIGDRAVFDSVNHLSGRSEHIDFGKLGRAVEYMVENGMLPEEFRGTYKEEWSKPTRTTADPPAWLIESLKNNPYAKENDR